MRILLVDDDTDLAHLLVGQCEGRGYTICHAVGAQNVRAQLSQHDYDVLVIDRMMPDMDGLQLLQHIRQAGHDMPVLILSALGEVEDRVQGLRAGGDDYLVKPFAFAELEARLLGLVRRGRVSPDRHKDKRTDTHHQHLQVADLTLDLLSRIATRDGQVIDLTAREFTLLVYLMQHQGQEITRKMILENVWQYNFHAQTNVVDVHISKLRAKIDKGFGAPLIHTVRGVGFMMRADG